MNHYKLVKQLLEQSSSAEEHNTINKIIQDMHQICASKKVEDCKSPCHVQSTKRGSFCIYDPGELTNLGSDLLHFISDQSATTVDAYIFIREESSPPGLLNPNEDKKPKQRTGSFKHYTLYFPDSMWQHIGNLVDHLLNEENQPFIWNIRRGFPALNHSIKEIFSDYRPVENRIQIDHDMAIKYGTIHFDIYGDQPEEVLRMLINKWAALHHIEVSRYIEEQFRAATENVPRMLYCFKISKKFAALQATHKNL